MRHGLFSINTSGAVFGYKFPFSTAYYKSILYCIVLEVGPMHAPEKGSRRVVIIGAGFGGLSAAKRLVRHRELEITVIDRRNYHLFQPLLYQVAMAGLSPAQIAVPIRALLVGFLGVFNGATLADGTEC